jgi:hypothetical protein
MYSDRRKLGRTVVHQRAKLLLPNFDNPEDCVVRNLTSMGACIEFDANRIGRIHKKFELSFDNFVTGWSCYVIWQFRGLVGVSWTCAFLKRNASQANHARTFGIVISLIIVISWWPTG